MSIQERLDDVRVRLSEAREQHRQVEGDPSREWISKMAVIELESEERRLENEMEKM